MHHKQVNQYSAGSKFFHWVIALAVVVMLCVGAFLRVIPDQWAGTAYMMHKSTGITILFLMILRFIWVHAAGKPPLPRTVALWEKVLARFVQYGFYVLLLAMPLSGWIMSTAADKAPWYFGWIYLPFPGIVPNKAQAHFFATVHLYIAWILLVFIVLHVSGALKHHLIDKDVVLKRMLPGRKGLS